MAIFTIIGPTINRSDASFKSNAGTDDNGDNDDVYGDLVDDNGDLSVSFQSTHSQVDSTTRLTAESSNLEKVSSEKSLIVILIVILSPSKS